MAQEIHIRAVAFREGDAWIAQGIDYDIVAHAGDPSELPDAFMRAVFENICITQHLGRTALQGIRPAPLRFAEMFEHARTQLRALELPAHFPVAGVDIRLAALSNLPH